MAHSAHHHDHVHLNEADWGAAAEHAELEAEVLLSFVTETAAWVSELRGPDASPVRRVFDIGSGPGVGTCELARQFPEAAVIAIDGSQAMLDRAAQRAAEHHLGTRIRTHLAELPGGLDALEPADVTWASLSLHHVGDEVAALRALRHRMNPDGIIAIAEIAEPMRMLPTDIGIGRPGLADRLDQVWTTWFASMRAGLTDSVPSQDLPSMLHSAGFEVVGSRLARERLDPPLAGDARRLVIGNLRRAHDHFADRLDPDDIATLEVLIDPDDPRGVMHRPDAFVHASRQVVVARRD